MHKLDYLRVDGQLLKLFLAVFNNNSVSAAALELDINQSSVSYSLEKLREIFKDPLFIKSGRGIVPTDRALELIPLVHDLLLRMEAITSPQTYFPQTDTRPFTIAADITQWSPLCTRLYKKVSKAAPNAPFRLLNLGSLEHLHPWLETGKVNLIISPKIGELHSDIMFQPIFSEEQVCFYDPNIRTPPNSVKEYSAARHAVLDFGGHRTSLVGRILQKKKINRKVFLCAPDMATLADSVKGTDIIFTMRKGLHKSFFSNFAFCPTPIPFPPVTYNLVWHRRRHDSPGNIWFRKMVFSAYEETKSGSG